MTTITLSELRLSPQLTLARSDHQQLARLALAGSGHSADAADDLLYELDRAQIVDDPAVPDDVVRMGSQVKYRTGRDERTVMLVWPAEADIAERRRKMQAVLEPFGVGVRTALGDYQLAFWTAGVLCVIAGLSFLTVGKSLRPREAPAGALPA